MIKTVYTWKPDWPPEDNHPGAKRLEIEHATRGKLYIDYMGKEPTVDEINKHFEEAKGNAQQE